MQLRKISCWQLMLLLFLARVMHTMIYRFDNFTSGTPIMLGLLVTTAIEAVLCLPAVLYFSQGGTDMSREIAGRRSKLIEFLYSIYFTVIAGGTVALFAVFLHNEFVDTVTPVVAVICLAIAAAYCAILGIEGLARAGTVVFWIFAAFFIWMAVVSEGEFNWLNIRPLIPGDAPQLWSYVLESISSAWWIPMLCILGSHLRGGAWKTAAGFLTLKLVIIEALLFLITLVLWRYTDVLGYPIFALGAYAKSEFIQRFDAINMLVWALNCALVTAVYIFISAKPLGETRTSAVLFAALASAFAIYEYKRGIRFNEPWFLWLKLVGIALLGVVIPIAALTLRIIRKKKGGHIQ